MRLRKASNGNGRITEVEEVTNLMASALAELIRPAIEKAYQMKQQKSGSLGLIINPDFRSMEPKKLLEEFLKLVKEEQQARVATRLTAESKREKRRCPICEAELDEDDDICPVCGSYVDEPAYDAEDDLEE